VSVPIRAVRRRGAVAEAEARLAARQAELRKQINQVNLQVQEAYEQVLESDKIVNCKMYIIGEFARKCGRTVLCYRSVLKLRRGTVS
jgi:hypothetical protein